jgi:hypothetical protein
MLWYKAWLETRWRFLFMIGSMMLVWFGIPSLVPGAPMNRLWLGLQLGSILLYCCTALFLAGAGVNTQTTYAATSGFHGSMLFTLSLPISRRRLLFVRAGLGAIETCILVAMMAGLTLFKAPVAASPLQALQYETRAIVCTMSVYALSVLLACVLDEMWQFMGSGLALSAFFMLQSRFDVVSRISPLRGMSLISYPAAAPIPWAPMAASLVFAAVSLYASVLVQRRKEY